MMKGFRSLFLVFSLLLLAQGVIRSQEYASWDDLLDRYERICKMCLELKASNASDGQIAVVLNELGSLKEELKSARDRMPAAARRRYEAIRSMYSSGVPADTRPMPAPKACAPLSLSPPVAPVTGSLCGKTQFAGGAMPSMLYYRFSASAAALVVPEFTPGLKVQYVGSLYGAYAGIYSNFSNHRTSYQALSDGTTGGAPVWTTGVSAVDRLFITAGPVYRLNDHFSVYGGLGYGMRSLCWEDSEGAWMEVTDASRRGLCAELGANLHLGRFTLGAGWLGLPFSYNALSVSVGWSFGRRYLKY